MMISRLAMIFSIQTKYALRALPELAAKEVEGYVTLDQIIAGTGMPRDFLAKVFHRLVRGGVLRGTKGRGGGFILARPAHQITLMHVVEAIDGPGTFDRCVMGMERCNVQMPCPQHDLYKPIRQWLKDYLNNATLADLVPSLRSKRTVLAATPSPATTARKQVRRPLTHLKRKGSVQHD